MQQKNNFFPLNAIDFYAADARRLTLMAIHMVNATPGRRRGILFPSRGSHSVKWHCFHSQKSKML